MKPLEIAGIVLLAIALGLVVMSYGAGCAFC